MKPLHKRILSALFSGLTSLSSVLVTMPPDTTLASIPLLAWVFMLLSGIAGFYSPKAPVVDLELKEIKAP